MKKPAVLVIGGLLAALAGWYLIELARSRSELIVVEPESPGSTAEPSPESAKSSELEPTIGAASRVTTSNDPRIRPPVPALVVTFRDFDGQPITNGTCTWDVLPKSDHSGLYVWGLDDPLENTSVQRLRHTDGRGAVQFDSSELPATGVETLLWAWAPGREATWAVVPPASSESAISIDVVLKQHESLSVSVINDEGDPIEGAMVSVVGLVPSSDQPQELGRRAFHGFKIVELTDEAGKLLVSPLPGTSVVWAEKEDLIGVPVLDVSPTTTELELVLGRCFLASGSVTLSDPRLFDTAMQVTAFAQDGAATVRVAQARVHSGGLIRPFRVPLIKTDKYDFVLRGGNGLPAHMTTAVPSAGAHVTLHFDVLPGATLRVKVKDDAARPVSGATIVARWTAAGGDGQVALTNEEGVALVRGIHPSKIDLRATARGFIPTHFHSVGVDEYREDGVEMILFRGGTLRGRVSRANRRIENFSVVYWPPTAAQDRVETEFRLAKDGRFEIDGVPLGDLLLYASSKDYPRSEVRSVRTSAETPVDVELELPDSLSGRGLVVDGNSAEPVPAAKIQLWNSYRAGYLTPFGGQHPVGIDGRFELKGFPPGDSRFVVRADGYSQYLGQAFGVPGETIDCGIIALQRAQRLQVRLTSTAPIDFTAFEADADGNAPYGAQRFNQDGLVVWPDAGPNVYFVRVYLPDGTLMTLERYCRPGNDWEFVFPQDPTRTLELSLVDADGRPATLVGNTVVVLNYTAPGGHQLSHIGFPNENSQTTFGTVAARAVYAEVVAESGDRLGAATLTIDDGKNEARLVLGGKRLGVHVTNREGESLEGASLDARMAAGESPWFQLTSTDAAGLHTFTGLAMKRLFINVQHNKFGSKSDVEVDLETWKSEDTLEIVLDPRATVAVRLVDGSTPVVAANLRILGPHSHHILGVFTTDANGVVRHGPVTPGPYLISVEQPGVWLTEKIIEAGDKDIPRDVQVRKLGGLGLRLNSGNEPAPGVAVELESIESGSRLSDWVQRGLVHLPSGALVTDASGLARVDGIPHGEYLVRVTTQAGPFVAGRVTVKPGPVTNVELAIP